MVNIGLKERAVRKSRHSDDNDVSRPGVVRLPMRQDFQLQGEIEKAILMMKHC